VRALKGPDRHPVVGALLLAFVVLVGPQGGTTHGDAGSCGGDWTGTRECHLLFRGFPLVVDGDAQSSGIARVTVELMDETTGAVLVACSEQDTDRVDCYEEVGVGVLVDLRPLSDLLCRVTGAQGGFYRCVSSTGI
jgi:hypothetical protein